MNHDHREIRQAAAQDERHTLITQAIAEHQNLITTEMARFQGVLDHIERVYKLRIGET